MPRAYLLAALVVVSFNLRPGLVTIGPVLAQLGRTLGLDSVALGVLTSLPILALGIFSWIADPLGRRIGWSRGVALAGLFIGAGILIRSLGIGWTAFLGSAIVGAGVGLGGVYVPALIKANFPHRIGALMGVYTMMLTFGSMASVAATAPLLHGFGGDWRPTLGVWAFPAFAGAVLWVPLRRVSAATATGAVRVPLWRSPLAWIVALNMGLQSALFYALASWLAALLQGRGESVAASAIALSWFYAPMLVGGFAGPISLQRIRPEWVPAAGWGVLSLASLLGALAGPPALVPPACAVLGFALGGVFGVALSFLVLRARTPQTAASLSSMGQFVGYVVASLGPFALGGLRALPDAARSSLAFLVALTVLVIVFAVLGARPLFVDDDRR